MHAAALAERARDRPHRLPARQRRPLGARTDRRRTAAATPPARCCSPGDEIRRGANRLGGRGPERAAARGDGASRARGRLRAALPRPGVRAPGAGPAEPDPERAGRGLRRGSTRRATAIAIPRARLELVTIRVAAVEPGPEPRPRAAGDGELAEASAGRASTASWLETARPAGRAGRRVRAPRARASSSCPRRRWSSRPAGRVRGRGGHDHARARRSDGRGSTRSPCR